MVMDDKQLEQKKIWKKKGKVMFREERYRYIPTAEGVLGQIEYPVDEDDMEHMRQFERNSVYSAICVFGAIASCGLIVFFAMFLGR